MKKKKTIALVAHDRITSYNVCYTKLLRYEDYIQDNILIPNGITDMHIGNSYAVNKRTNEVNYFEAEGSSLVPEYNGSGKMVAKSNGGNPIELLGAAGGWTCSAIELARLVTYIDGESGVPDILKASSVAEMTDNRNNFV